MLSGLFEYQFLRNAFFAGILASVVCGIIGVVVIEKKLVMLSGGIAHTAYGGVGLGYLLGFKPIYGAFLFSVSAALGIGYIKRKGQVKFDLAISLFWSLGMALGILFISLMPGYPPDMSSYLFGNILSVTKSELYLTAGITAFITLVFFIFYNYWKAYLFDEEYAHILGLNTAFMEYLLLVLVAMTVVALIRVAGIILILALLTAPAATAGLLTSDFKRRIVYSVLLGMFFCVSGLFISYETDISTGTVIVILSVLCYFALYALKSVIEKKQERGANPRRAS